MYKEYALINIKFTIIDEYKGDGGFYESAKHTPDLNLARALNCLNDIVTEKHVRCCDVILIDRGVFDTYCWFKWFEKRQKLSDPLLNLSENFIQTLKTYSCKYHIAWMDIDPIVSIAQHSRSGSIVNMNTLEGLREQYRNATEINKWELSISRVESEKATSEIHAMRLVQQFKLAK